MRITFSLVSALALLSVAFGQDPAPTPPPSMLVPNLSVRPVIEGLTTPINMAFLGPNDFFVTEKSTGRVKRVTNGEVSIVLDLNVNSASERGLLGIALHPNFQTDKGVYLYWTETTSNSDSAATGDTPVMGNRVDRFRWNGSTLTFDRNLVRLRSFQADDGQPPRGNHNGGVIRFGPDGKLYVIMGDNGRRGQLQNLQFGPFGTDVTDDQFGGPAPDIAHLTGVVLRLNDDGTTPSDNPFVRAATDMNLSGVAKIFAYGVRNSFGMAFDPLSGNLWTQENGDDSFDEINRVEAGMNGGWVQFMGPSNRIGEFKQIEMSRAGGLQQVRWLPTNIAATPAEAMSRLVMLPGAQYSEPEFSWKYAIAPAAIGFVNSDALGAEYRGNLIVGASIPAFNGGYLLRLGLTGDRTAIAVTDPRLEDRVADNTDKFDITESESLSFGRDFGIGTDIQTGPNGNLYVVSLNRGAVYEIFRQP